MKSPMKRLEMLLVFCRQNKVKKKETSIDACNEYDVIVKQTLFCKYKW